MCRCHDNKSALCDLMTGAFNLTGTPGRNYKLFFGYSSVTLRLFFGYAGKVAMRFRNHLTEVCYSSVTLRLLFGYSSVMLVFFEKYVSAVSRHDGQETSAQSLAGMPVITRSPGLRIP